MSEHLEVCTDCGVRLPTFDNDNRPRHAYIGASASCWDVFTRLWHADDPSLEPMPLNALILDAYCVQHHGVPSPAAIQSVAVHLLALYGVLRRDVPAGRVQWIRERMVRPMKVHRHDRWYWLEPPDQTALPTVRSIVEATDATKRAEAAQHYVTSVADLWLDQHESDARTWFNQYVAD